MLLWWSRSSSDVSRVSQARQLGRSNRGSDQLRSSRPVTNLPTKAEPEPLSRCPAMQCY